MFSDVFLAVTAPELAEFRPKRVAYMACHFSAYSKGLSNLPDYLPSDSMLLLDDCMPPKNHEPSLVAAQLIELIENFSVKAVILDFQKNETAECKYITSFLLRKLPCPVAVTEKYAKELGCPVFLSPTPVNRSLQEHLTPWLQQGVYLEIAPLTLQVTVTKTGSSAVTFTYTENLPLYDKKLFCHYDVHISPDKAVFILSRSKEDLASLTQQAKALGVREIIGLHQELFLL